MPKDKLKEIRAEADLSQRAIAEIMGIPQRTWEDWETGRRSPPEYVIELIEYKLKKEKIIK